MANANGSSNSVSSTPSQLQQLQMQLQLERQQVRVWIILYYFILFHLCSYRGIILTGVFLYVAQAARQQLERLPRRSQAASNGATVGLAVNPLTVLGGTMAGLTATNQAATAGGDQTCVASQASTTQSNSQFILGR